jgi:hypothetical protein
MLKNLGQISAGRAVSSKHKITGKLEHQITPTGPKV